MRPRSALTGRSVADEPADVADAAREFLDDGTYGFRTTGVTGMQLAHEAFA
jgi:hypothetical protein